MTVTTRNRSIGAFTGIVSQYWKNDLCTTWYKDFEYSYGVGEKRTMTDTIVKGFKRRSAAGEVFFNPMEKVQRIYTDGGGHGGLTRNTTLSCNPQRYHTYEFRHQMLPYMVPSYIEGGLYFPDILDVATQSEIDNLVTEVSTSMMNQRGRADSNLFETLAELDQTFDLFNRPLDRLRNTLASASRARTLGRFAGYASNGMSNLWLAYRYGIRPIVQDFHSIIEGLKETTERKRQSTRAKGGFELSSVTTGSRVSGNFTYHYKRQAWDSITVRAMSLDEVQLSVLENIGFTTKGLLTLPWELVPYSFVVDWFVNVGDYIGSLTPSPGWNQLGSALTVTRGRLTEYTTNGQTANNSSYAVTTPWSGSFKAQNITKYRVSVPRPGIVVKSDFRFDKGTRIADALALSSQKLLRIFR